MQIKTNNIVNNLYLNTIHRSFVNFLSPLKQDTVSFSGSTKLTPEYMQYAPDHSTCKNVANNAVCAHHYMKLILEKYVDPYKKIYITDKNKNFPVYSVESRIKSPNSIREKVISKYSKRISNESENFSSKVFENLSQNFKMNEKYSKGFVKNYIKKSTDEIYQANKVPLFQNAEYCFPEIIEKLRKINVFDFDSVPINIRKKIFTEMVDSLKDCASDDYVIGNRYIDPTTSDGIKYYAQDIVGGRIIMNDPDPKNTILVIDSLTQAVKDGKLKITSIETNVPDQKRLPKGAQISDYLYATDSQLRTLAKAADAKLIKNNTKSGYMAIHINVDLSNSLFADNDAINNYKGEIQIIGRDVAQLKSVEDLCYKLKDNKNVVSSNYEPFKEHFLKYYKGNTKKHFEDYTYALYLEQRRRPYSETGVSVFPTIKDLGFEGKVPKELDYNVLRNIKNKCDKNEQNEQKKKRSKHSLSRMDGDTHTSQDDLKSLLKYSIYSNRN